MPRHSSPFFSASVKRPDPRPTRALIEELEPRLLYSADFAPTLADSLILGAEERVIGGDGEYATTTDSQRDAQHARFEVVFIDLRVEGYQQILADIREQNGDGRSLEVILLDSERDGIEQIGDFLNTRQEIDAIHIISHGGAGSVQLGSGQLNFDSMINNAAAIKQWGSALNSDADILIYGCNLASTADGQSLIDALSRLTGADVAASDDNTGDAALGGNWILEYQTGLIQTQVAVSAYNQQNWHGVLATYTVTTTSDMGMGMAGSLRWAINNANANAGADTIEFSIAGTGVKTINLLSALPTITEAVFINGTTQTGYAGAPLIELNGASAGMGVTGLTITASNSTIRGLIINQFDFGGSTGNGILITGASATGNLITGNYIGTDSTGTLNRENGFVGVRFTAGAHDNQVGGTTPADANIIAFNEWGVGVTTDAGTGNAILGNAIFSNTNQGINLDTGGITPNDLGDIDTGANNLQNFPVLSSASTNAMQATLTGSLNSTANSYFRVEFFANTTADATGYGEGQRYLGYANVTTDGSGNATFNKTLTATVAAGEFVSATATKSNITFTTFTDTSEFAQNILATANATPINISLSSTSVNENINTSSGYSIGTLSTNDPDALDTFTYSIVGGADADAGKFSIGGAGLNELRLTDGLLNYEIKSSYAVTVRTTDSGGATFDKAFTIAVNNVAGNISGVAYTDQGITTIAAGKTMNLVINGASVESVVTGAGGTYSFTREASAGDRVLIYIDNDATYKGATVTVANGSNISNVPIYAATLMLRSDNGGALTNADIATALGGYSDTDLQFGVSSGNLVATVVNTRVLVAAGQTYTPGGNVTADSFNLFGTVNGGSSTFTVAANWSTTGGTFNAGTSTVAVVSRASGFSFQPGTTSYYNVSLDTNDRFFTLSGNLTATNDFTLKSSASGIGTLTLGSNSITTKNFIWPSGYLSHSLGAVINMTGNFTNTGGSFFSGSGSGLILNFMGSGNSFFTPGTSTLGTVVINKASQSDALTLLSNPLVMTSSSSLVLTSGIFDLAGRNLNIGVGSSFSNNGTLRLQGSEVLSNFVNDTDSGSVVYNGVGSYAGLAAGNAYFYLGFNNGAGSWVLNAALDVNADLNLAGGTLDTNVGGNYAINVFGNWSNTGNFLARNGSVILDGNNQTISGSSTFYNLRKTEVTNNATDTTLSFAAGTTQTINSLLTLDGLDADDRINLVSAAPGTQWRLNLTASASKAIDFIRVSDSDASLSDPSHNPVSPISAIDAGNNIGWFAGANNAPTLNSSPVVSFTPITEDDVNNPGNLVSFLINGAISDIDVGALQGIAIHATSLSGADFEYSLNGGTSWSSVGAVGNATALLLRDTDRIRLVPNGNNAGSGAILYWAWDRTSGIAGTKVDANTRGGSTAFSTGAELATANASAINDAPVITSGGGGDTFSTNAPENSTYVATITATDVDVPVQTLSYSITGGADSSKFTINSSTGVLSFITPPSYENPQGSLSGGYAYEVIVAASDGSLSDTQTINVIVWNVNDPPVITSNGGGSTAAINVAENSTAVTTVTATDEDFGPQVLTYTISGGADAVRFSINSSTGVLQFVTAPNFEIPVDADGNNVYEVIVKVMDSGGASDTQALSVIVTNVNEAPVAVNDSYTINEDSGGFLPMPGVLGNDYDVDSASLTAQLVSGTTQGTLTLNANGSFWYWPNPNYFGTDSFTYRVSDGALTSNVATVTITINPVNDAPIAVADAFSGNEDAPILGNVLSNDTDIDSATLTAGLLAGPSNGVLMLNANGSFTYTPNANFNGTDSFTYRANDGALNSNIATVTLTINPVNDAPLITMNQLMLLEGSTVVLSNANLNASDLEQSPAQLTYTISNVTRGQFELSAAPSSAISTFTQADVNAGLVVFVHDASDFAPTYDVTVSDGLLSQGPQTAAITFTTVNEGINIFSISGYTTSESGGSMSFDVTLNSQPFADVTIPMLSNNPAEGLLSTTSLTFTSANWNIAQRVTVTGLQDFYNDGDQAYSVQFQPALSADPNYNALSVSDLVLTNLDVPMLLLTEPPLTQPAPSTDNPASNPVVDTTTVADADAVQAEEPATVSDLAQAIPEGGDSIGNPGGPGAVTSTSTLHHRLPLVFTQETTSTQVLTDPETQSQILMRVLEILQIEAIETSAGSGEMTSPIQVEITSEENFLVKIVSQGAEITAVSLSVGTVWWALRVGGLFASLLTSMPAWRSFDLLPVLARDQNDDDDADDPLSAPAHRT